MEVYEIKPKWWVLVSYGDEQQDRLMFFGYSREEVIGKFNSYMRQKILEPLR